MRRRWPFILLLLAVVPLLAFGMWWMKIRDEEERAVRYALSDAELALLQDGDIILRRGSGMVSDMIAGMLNEDHDLSHCGILVLRDGVFRVVHAVSNNISDHDGMQVHGLQEFVRQSRPGSLVVCRLRTDRDRSVISRRAIRYLKQRVPFDHHFDRTDSSSFYCSELPWRILRDEFGVDIFADAADGGLEAFRFGRFMDPRWFDVVLDHQKNRPERSALRPIFL